MPSISVGPIELLWITINTVTLVLTLTAFIDARVDRDAVRKLNGNARELAASGIVTSEALRVGKQLILLGIAVPSLFSDREVTLSYGVVGLMALCVLLLVQSVLATRLRKRLLVLSTAEALEEKEAALARIEEGLDDVKTRIARQAAALVAQGIIQADMSDAADTTAAALKVTVDDTHEKVVGIDQRTGGGK